MVLEINRPLSLFVWALFIFTTIVIALTIHSQDLDDYGKEGLINITLFCIAAVSTSSCH